jgi:tetratricopeptide (TPR) repeat protein
MTAILIGCASTDKAIPKNKDYEKYLRKHSPAVHGKSSSYFPEETSSPKVVPELSSDTHEWSGDVHFRKGELRAAYLQYSKSLKLDPDNTRVHYKLGLVFLAGGLNDEAMAEFQEVIKSDPEHELAYMGLGQVFFVMEKYGKAEKLFRKAIELDPNLWKSHNFLGVIHDYRNQHEKAVPQYVTAISLKPHSALLHNNLGLSYYLAGDYENSIKAFRKALRLDASQKKIYNNLALALSKSGRFSEAFEAFRKGGNEAQAHNNMGCVYSWQGESGKAIRSFEKAIEVRPDFYEKANENLRRCRTNREEQSLFNSRPEPSIESPAQSRAAFEVVLPDF